MAGAKQTPRQRLIGLMYLIFLALMALNVSVEVLDSFPLINNSIEQTNKNFEMKVGMVYDDFNEQRLLFSDQHVAPYHGQALYIKAIADSLVDFIRTNRSEMLARVNNVSFEEADTMNLMDSRNKDNYSISSRFWLIENSEDPGIRDGGPGTRSYALREKIELFKSSMDSIMTTHDQTIQHTLDVDGPFHIQDRRVNWQQRTFDRVISVAVATELNRLITDIRNAEFDAVSMLYDLITAGDFRFDQIAARVVPRSQIVFQGDHFEADVFVAAYDTRQNPDIYVDGIGRISVTGGVGRLRIPASGTGARNIRGEIVMVSPAGVQERHPFSTTYIVQAPQATVSADAMNVFYIGVDNPVSIAAGGPTETVRPAISAGASIRQVDTGSYIVNVDPGTQEVTVRVNTVIEGEAREMGQFLFRARNLPTPTAYIAGRRDGRVDRQLLTAVPAIEARMENFDFDARFEIESFRMTTTIAGDYRQFQGTGSRFTDEMIRIIESARSGQEVTFRDIVTRPGPDGTTRNLGAISFTIN